MHNHEIDSSSFSTLVQSFSAVASKAIDTSDNITALMLEGDFKNAPSMEELQNLELCLEELDLEKFLSVNLDGEEVKALTLTEIYPDCDVDAQWRINFSKPNFVDSTDSDIGYLFFISEIWAQAFFNTIQAFNRKSRIHWKRKVIVVVLGLEKKIVGANLLVLAPKDITTEFSINFMNLPNQATINDYLKYQTEEDTIVNPKKFACDQFPGTLGSHLRKNFILSLVASLATVLDKKGEVRVDGIRSVQLALTNFTESVTEEKLKNIRECVEWIYEGIYSTRQRLFIDRILLELRENDTFLQTILKNGQPALEQAIKQFQFVIEDRRDQYYKELQSALVEVKKQTDLYFDKLRGLLLGLSRDVLAAIFLIGISFMTRTLSNSDSVTLSKPLSYIFSSVGVYLIVSWSFQSLLTITDAVTSRGHLMSWLAKTRLYVEKTEQDKLLDNSLKKRRITFWVMYGAISVLYLGLGITALVIRNRILELV